MDAKSILLIVLIVAIVGGLIFAVVSVLTMPVGTNEISTSEIIEDTTEVEKEKPAKNETKVEDTNTLVEPEPDPEPEPEPEPTPEPEESKTAVPYTLQNTGKYSYYNAKYTKYNDDSFQRSAQAHEPNPDNNYVIEYAIPSSYSLQNGEFVSPNGELSVKAEVYPISDFLPEDKNVNTTTPDVFMTYFASKLGEADFYTRNIKLNGFSATTVVKDTGDQLITYCVYAYDSYVYYLQATATRDTYNSVNSDMTKIFETIHICKEDEL